MNTINSFYKIIENQRLPSLKIWCRGRQAFLEALWSVPAFQAPNPTRSPASAQLGPSSELPGVSGQQTPDSTEPQLLLDLAPSSQGDPSLQSLTPKTDQRQPFFLGFFFFSVVTNNKELKGQIRPQLQHPWGIKKKCLELSFLVLSPGFTPTPPPLSWLSTGISKNS